MSTKIDWTYPEPGKGLIGSLDRFIGPGATRAEIALELGVAFVAAIAVPAYALWAGLGWSWLQLAVAAVLAFDIAGGVATNATASAKRWYHREGQGFWQHFAFTAVHLHPLIVAWLFLGMDWAFFGIVYGYLVLAAAAVLLTPLYLRRPVALTLYCGGLAVGLYALSPTPGLEWFVPLFYLKLLVSHILREEPYAPGGK